VPSSLSPYPIQTGQVAHEVVSNSVFAHRARGSLVPGKYCQISLAPISISPMIESLCLNGFEAYSIKNKNEKAAKN
jgi:hypothetical protein